MAIALVLLCALGLAPDAQSRAPHLWITNVQATTRSVAPGGVLRVRVRVRTAGRPAAKATPVTLRLLPEDARGRPGRRLAARIAPRSRRLSVTLPNRTAPGRYRAHVCTRRGIHRCRASQPFRVAQPTPASASPGGEPGAEPAPAGGPDAGSSEDVPPRTADGPADPGSPKAQPSTADLSVTNPIVAEGRRVNELRLTAKLTADSATITAAVPPKTGSAAGSEQIKVCLSTHAFGAAPLTRCTEAAMPSGGDAAVVVRRSVPRPAAGGRTWATGLALVGSRQSDGEVTWGPSSWPAAGISDAAIVIPDVDGAVSGPAPSQGVSLGPGSGTGGLLSGLPDSLCVARTKDGGAPPPELNLSTTALGTLPAYYEVGEPAGAYRGQAPKGVMIILHGGGWSFTGRGHAAAMRADAERWRGRGWRTVNASYRECGLSPQDVLAVHDAVRAKYGPRLPVCGLGASAGGHLALYLATQRDLYCAISQAGPANLTSLKHQVAQEAVGKAQTWGPRMTYNGATAAFGEENLAAYSPQLLGLRSRVLIAIAASDHLVPPAQAPHLRDALLAADPGQYVDAMVLPVGTGAYFIHGPVARAGLDEYYAHEQAVVAPLG
jgi:acetyl esterase/lipase